MLVYNRIGNLEPGIYDLSWQEFKVIFGFNSHRINLIKGLEQAISELRTVGCKTIYADGSFITKLLYPKDFDICWDEDGVNFELLRTSYYGLMDYGWKMRNMKKRYGGDIVPMTNYANERGTIFFEYFQEDKQKRRKGIIRISLI